METKDRDFAIATTLWGAALVTILGTGIVALIEDHIFWGVVICAVSILGLISLTLYLRGQRIPPSPAFAGLMLALTWVFLAYVVLTRPKEVIVHDPPTGEDIEKATAPIIASRDAEKQRADSARSEQAAADKADEAKFQLALVAMTNERDTFRKSLEGTIAQLNAARAQLGPKSEFLGLDDAKRWSIVVAMSQTKLGPCSAAVASDTGSGADNGNSIKVFDEVRMTLEYAGWSFGQASKTFFPPGITIISGEQNGHLRECALRLTDLLMSLNISPVHMIIDQGNPDLTNCRCIEVVLGKLDTP